LCPLPWRPDERPDELYAGRLFDRISAYLLIATILHDVVSALDSVPGDAVTMLDREARGGSVERGPLRDRARTGYIERRCPVVRRFVGSLPGLARWVVDGGCR
jgi:hypothetical protein